MNIKIEMVLRILIGLLLVNSGFNKFFQYMQMPEMAEGAMAFMMSMGKTGYLFPTIAVIEIIGGGLLISGRMIPFALVILAPIVYNILMIHALLDPSGIMVGIILSVSLGWIAWNRKESFSGLFV